MDDRSRGPAATPADESFRPGRISFPDNGETISFRDDAKKLPGDKARRRLGLRPLVLLCLVILLGFGVYRVTTAVLTPKEPATEKRAAAPQPVGIATIGTGDIKIVVTALGTVTPLATVTVKTQVNGQLLNVGFKEGQWVKKGDFLAQIDPRPFELAQAQYEGQLIHDQGLLDQARMDLARYQTLVKQNSIARQQAEDQVFLVKQYEGSVKLDQAQIDNQKLNLIYAHIVSPVDGRIGIRLVDPGNYVQTTDPGLVVVAQMHPISVIFIVPEDDIPEIMAAIHEGKPLEVQAYDRANVTYLSTGQVSALDSEIDTTTGTVKLRAMFENLDDKLFPNQFVNARLLLETLHDVITVPTTAIQRGAPGTFVYLLGQDDTVSVKPVGLGPLDGDKYAVNSGLSPGDRVVVDGADRLRDGAKVLVTTGGASSQKPPASGQQGESKHGRRQPPSGQ